MLVAKNGTLARIERNIISPAVERICRNRGSNYGAQDFLEGDKREKFQEDFRSELDKVCKADDVVIRSAFIRNIVIPESFLEPKRLEQLAVETRLTSAELTKTRATEAEVEKAKSMVAQGEAEVKAETARLVAVIEQETENLKKQTEAEIERMKAEYGAKVAQLDSERDKVLGEAKAEATKMKETALGSLYKMQMELFGRDGDAFLRYTMAKELNPKLVLRLFQSGPGTLWTNMGDKNLSLMVPLPGDKAKK
jgi:regulator of protease activity HflC (stomatin/prohibitin superfamily)